jgi:flavin-binding protein dodecin
MTTRVLPLLAAAALAVSGCGSDGSTTVDTKQIRSVVTQFATDNGPKACQLLSPAAVVNVYGSFTQPVTQARANCLAKASSFKGQAVNLTVLRVIDSDTVKQGAISKDGKVTYNVTLRKFGPSWRIDEITQHRTTP